VRFGEDAPRPRAVAVIPRIQLHDPSGIRFRGTEQASRHPPADGRFGSVGQYHQRYRSRSPYGNATALRPHLAAADDGIWPEDGQVTWRRHLAERRNAERL